MDSRKIVAIGGGTGLYTVLMGLKNYSQDVTAVVTMADDGGSSGRLRDEFGHLPPGDVRRCLIALSSENRVLRSLFEYRFDKGIGLNGHSFGNLFITALTEITGSTAQAILDVSKLLNISGQVLPVTTDDVRLMAELEDGTLVQGERNIDVRTVKPELKIEKVFLSPEATVYPPAADAIRNADVLVIGPGDLYTSLIPNLLVQGVSEAVRECRGVRVYVCNLMTKHVETDGFAASDFVSEVCRYLGGPGSLDCMVVNTQMLPADLLEKYSLEQAYPVRLDLERCQEMVPRVATGALASTGTLLRHDSQNLAWLIMQVAWLNKTQEDINVKSPAQGGAVMWP